MYFLSFQNTRESYEEIDIYHILTSFCIRFKRRDRLEIQLASLLNEEDMNLKAKMLAINVR